MTASASRDPDAMVVEEAAFALLGSEQIVGRWIVDDAGDDRAFALERQRDREVRNPVQEVHGAVERVDDPGVGGIGAGAPAAFLAEKAIARTRAVELLV